MDVAEFEHILLGLRSGDEVTFVFQGKIHWATRFLALFNTSPKPFSIMPGQRIDLEIINFFMLNSAVHVSSFAVKCSVLTALMKSGISVGWMAKYILPLLESFEVVKAGLAGSDDE